jgi:hypothetical protein
MPHPPTPQQPTPSPRPRPRNPISNPTLQKRPKLNLLPLPTLDPRRRRKLPRNKKLLLPLLNLDLLRKVRVLLELRLRRMSRGLDAILLVIVREIGGIMKLM